MNGQQLLDAIALADPAYIEAAEALPAPKQTAPARKSAAPVRLLALAACLCLVIGVAGVILTNPPFVHVGPTEPTRTTGTPVQTAPTGTTAPPPQTAPAGTTAPSGTAAARAWPRFQSVEELVEAALAGELGREIPGLEYFYAPAVEFPGYCLRHIEVSEWYICYWYVPIGCSDPDWLVRDGIRVVYSFKGTMEGIAKQYGLERTPEGHLYHPKESWIAFAVGDSRMTIEVPDSMNDYALLKTFCTARRVEIPGGAALGKRELLFLRISDPAEYEVFLKGQDDSFVSYEEVSCFGEFAEFCRSWQEGTDSLMYVYYLKDTSGELLWLSMEQPYEWDDSRFPRLPVPESPDLRTCGTEETAILEYNGLEYLYAGGKLSSISWEQDGFEFRLKTLSSFDFRSQDRKELGDLPIDSTTLLGQLLMGTVEVPVLPEE